MKLAEWLDLPNPDGSRKRRNEFAERIGVTPQMISAYCAESEKASRPNLKRQRKIFTETNGAVTPNDWVGVEQGVA